MQWICRCRLIGLTVLAAIVLTACGGSSDSGGQRVPNMEFVARTLPSGDSPSEWNFIWGCDVRTRTGNTTGLPLRFYRDGQLLAGMGTSELLGTWRVDVPSDIRTMVSLTLDEPAPQFFGTDNTELQFELWRHGENFMESTGTYAVQIPEDTTQFNLLCARYNQAGDVEGEDLPGWMRKFEETPAFLITGEADPQFVSQGEETIPAQDQAAPEPVTTPGTDTPTSDPVTTPTPGSPSGSAPLAEINAQVKDIWYTNDFVDTVDGVRQRNGSVIQFNNDEVSRDGETISNEGIAASKRNNPQDWGEGRVSSSGLLSYKWSNSRSWLEPFLSAPTRSYPRNQKIRGCYENSIGVKGSGSSPRIERLCFFEDGTFRLDDAGNNTGTYLIEGHAIRLNFSGGESAEFLFGAYYRDGFIYRLIIANRIFHVTE